jgi:ribulose-phosphate 3-epimerase
MNNKKVAIAPSLICLDLCNIAEEVRRLEEVGADFLHIDLIDGYFSPSMPIGIDVIKQLRKKTDMPFDVHLMVKDNEFFVQELLKIGVEQLCFHYESCLHVNRLLNLIKREGTRAGIALSPSTSLSVLDYTLDDCDFVMLMLINPGYAGDTDECQPSYVLQKIADLRSKIADRDLGISVDGRISAEQIPQLISKGASLLVAGTSCLFNANGSLAQNMSQIREKIKEGSNEI